MSYPSIVVILTTLSLTSTNCATMMKLHTVVPWASLYIVPVFPDRSRHLSFFYSINLGTFATYRVYTSYRQSFCNSSKFVQFFFKMAQYSHTVSTKDLISMYHSHLWLLLSSFAVFFAWPADI